MVPLELTIEQEFILLQMSKKIHELPEEEAQNMVLEMMRQLMVKDNVIKDLVGKAILNGIL